VNNSTLVFNYAGTGAPNYSPPAISGSGALYQNSSSGTTQTVVILNTGDSYTGTTTINGGFLQVASDACFGIPPASYVADQLAFNGGALLNDGAALTINVNRGITLGPNGGYFRSGFTQGTDNTTINSIITGSGALTLVNDKSTLVLANTGNTYLGPTTIGSSNPDYAFTNGAAFASIANLANGGLPSSIGESSNAAANLVFGGGDATLTYTGGGASTDRLFTLASNAAFNASGSGPVTFSNTGAIAFSGSGSYTLTLGGSGPGVNTMTPSISDNGPNPTSLAVNGTNYWLVSGSNSFSGGTTVSGGTLGLGSAAALGAATSPLTVNSSTLDLNGFSPMVGGLTGNSFALITNNGSSNSTLTVSPSAATVYNGSIANGPTNTVALSLTGSGMLTLAGSNGYSGGTTVSGGTLQLGNNNALGSPTGPLTITGGTGSATLDLFGNSPTVGALTGDSGASITNSSFADSLLTISQSTTTTYAGTIGNGNSQVALTLDGPGELVLSGVNTYTGGTTVAGGELVAASPSALYDGSSLTVGQGAGAIFAPAGAASPAGLAAVPEPSADLLLLAAIGAGVVYRRFRRHRR
jgi:fibronectin-binding autotransporter adhesin